MEKLDEVALNVLLMDSDVEPGTAYAASVRDTYPQPARLQSHRKTDIAFTIGLVIGVVLFLLWLS